MLRDTLISLITRAFARLFPTTQLPASFAPKRLLILKPCCLGDVIMATPVITVLHREFPDAEIDFAVGSWSRVIVANHPHLHHIIDTGRVGQGTYDWRNVWQLARRLRAYQYDLCLTLDRSPRVGMVAWLAGIPYRAGLDSHGRGFAHNLRVPVPPIRYEPELYLDVPRTVTRSAQTARSKFEFAPTQFFPTAEDHATVAKILNEKKIHPPITKPPLLIAIHPGGGNNPGMVLTSKRWPTERFAVIAERLRETYGAMIVLIGARDDALITQAVRAAMKHKDLSGAERENLTGLLDLTGQLTIGQLGALYERCVMMLGNDSGVLHLANAMGTPVVALYGPSDPRVYGPYNAKSLALWHEVGCNPCFVQGRARADCCPNHAIEAISLEECWEAAQIVLRRQGIERGKETRKQGNKE
jgi:lipopolysaccharide heptosyltransferase II